MRQIDINGTLGRKVVICVEGKHASARLYVNNGETATHTTFKGKTEKGAHKWAAQVLGAAVPLSEGAIMAASHD